jgi:hypothetical protein
MALDRDMQPPRLARAQPLELLLQRRQPWQHILRQPSSFIPAEDSRMGRERRTNNSTPAWSSSPLI